MATSDLFDRVAALSMFCTNHAETDRGDLAPPVKIASGTAVSEEDR